MNDISLGLCEITYNRLSREFTTVVHNPWRLNFVSDVNRFEDEYIGDDLNSARIIEITY